MYIFLFLSFSPKQKFVLFSSWIEKHRMGGGAHHGRKKSGGDGDDGGCETEMVMG